MENVAVSSVEKRILSLSLTKKLILTLFFVVIQALSSKIKIFLPFSPVPITLQTFSVILSGIILKETAIFTQILYIALGILGVNLFANGGGLSYIYSPTFGYVFGFIFASLIAGYFTKRFSSTKMLILGLVVSDLSIYIPGLIWLYVFISLTKGNVSIPYLLSIGFIPFLVGDSVKVLSALGFAKFLKKI